jgi:hypothetical protein
MYRFAEYNVVNIQCDILVCKGAYIYKLVSRGVSLCVIYDDEVRPRAAEEAGPYTSTEQTKWKCHRRPSAAIFSFPLVDGIN